MHIACHCSSYKYRYARLTLAFGPTVLKTLQLATLSAAATLPLKPVHSLYGSAYCHKGCHIATLFEPSLSRILSASTQSTLARKTIPSTVIVFGVEGLRELKINAKYELLV